MRFFAVGLVLSLSAVATSAKGRGLQTICPPGTYMDDRGACIDCPVGTYSTTENVPQCARCPDGMTTQSLGSTSESQCIPSDGGAGSEPSATPTAKADSGSDPRPSATATATAKANGGAGSEPSATPTAKADSGSDPRPSATATATSKPDPTSGNVCRPGSYRTSDGQCEMCAAGTYSEQQDAQMCTPCPDGTMSLPGAVSADACRRPTDPLPTPSAAATSKPDPTSGDVCRPGSYRTSDGQCEMCAAGTYSEQQDAQMCTPCPVGTMSLPGAESADTCRRPTDPLPTPSAAATPTSVSEPAEDEDKDEDEGESEGEGWPISLRPTVTGVRVPGVSDAVLHPQCMNAIQSMESQCFSAIMSSGLAARDDTCDHACNDVLVELFARPACWLSKERRDRRNNLMPLAETQILKQQLVVLSRCDKTARGARCNSDANVALALQLFTTLSYSRIAPTMLCPRVQSLDCCLESFRSALSMTLGASTDATSTQTAAALTQLPTLQRACGVDAEPCTGPCIVPDVYAPVVCSLDNGATRIFPNRGAATCSGFDDDEDEEDEDDTCHDRCQDLSGDQAACDAAPLCKAQEEDASVCEASRDCAVCQSRECCSVLALQQRWDGQPSDTACVWTGRECRSRRTEKIDKKALLEHISQSSSSSSSDGSDGTSSGTSGNDGGAGRPSSVLNIGELADKLAAAAAAAANGTDGTDTGSGSGSTSTTGTDADAEAKATRVSLDLEKSGELTQDDALDVELTSNGEGPMELGGLRFGFDCPPEPEEERARCLRKLEWIMRRQRRENGEMTEEDERKFREEEEAAAAAGGTGTTQEEEEEEVEQRVRISKDMRILDDARVGAGAVLELADRVELQVDGKLEIGPAGVLRLGRGRLRSGALAQGEGEGEGEGSGGDGEQDTAGAGAGQVRIQGRLEIGDGETEVEADVVIAAGGRGAFAGNGSVILRRGARIRVDPEAVISMRNSSQVITGEEGATFENEGELEIDMPRNDKSVRMDIPVVQRGRMNVRRGRVLLERGMSSQGELRVDRGATVELGGSTVFDPIALPPAAAPAAADSNSTDADAGAGAGAGDSSSSSAPPKRPMHVVEGVLRAREAALVSFRSDVRAAGQIRAGRSARLSVGDGAELSVESSTSTSSSSSSPDEEEQEQEQEQEARRMALQQERRDALAMRLIEWAARKEAAAAAAAAAGETETETSVVVERTVSVQNATREDGSVCPEQLRAAAAALGLDLQAQMETTTTTTTTTTETETETDTNADANVEREDVRVAADWMESARYCGLLRSRVPMDLTDKDALMDLLTAAGVPMEPARLDELSGGDPAKALSILLRRCGDAGAAADLLREEEGESESQDPIETASTASDAVIARRLAQLRRIAVRMGVPTTPATSSSPAMTPEEALAWLSARLREAREARDLARDAASGIVLDEDVDLTVAPNATLTLAADARLGSRVNLAPGARVRARGNYTVRMTRDSRAVAERLMAAGSDPVARAAVERELARERPAIEGRLEATDGAAVELDDADVNGDSANLAVLGGARLRLVPPAKRPPCRPVNTTATTTTTTTASGAEAEVEAEAEAEASLDDADMDTCGARGVRLGRGRPRGNPREWPQEIREAWLAQRAERARAAQWLRIRQRRREALLRRRQTTNEDTATTTTTTTTTISVPADPDTQDASQEVAELVSMGESQERAEAMDDEERQAQLGELYECIEAVQPLLLGLNAQTQEKEEEEQEEGEEEEKALTTELSEIRRMLEAAGMPPAPADATRAELLRWLCDVARAQTDAADAGMLQVEVTETTETETETETPVPSGLTIPDTTSTSTTTTTTTTSGLRRRQQVTPESLVRLLRRHLAELREIAVPGVPAADVVPEDDLMPLLERAHAGGACMPVDSIQALWTRWAAPDDDEASIRAVLATGVTTADLVGPSGLGCVRVLLRLARDADAVFTAAGASGGLEVRGGARLDVEAGTARVEGPLVVEGEVRLGEGATLDARQPSSAGSRDRDHIRSPGRPDAAPGTGAGAGSDDSDSDRDRDDEAARPAFDPRTTTTTTAGNATSVSGRIVARGARILADGLRTVGTGSLTLEAGASLDLRPPTDGPCAALAGAEMAEMDPELRRACASRLGLSDERVRRTLAALEPEAAERARQELKAARSARERAAVLARVSRALAERAAAEAAVRLQRQEEERVAAGADADASSTSTSTSTSNSTVTMTTTEPDTTTEADAMMMERDMEVAQVPSDVVTTTTAGQLPDGDRLAAALTALGLDKEEEGDEWQRMDRFLACEKRVAELLLLNHTDTNSNTNSSVVLTIETVLEFLRRAAGEDKLPVSLEDVHAMRDAGDREGLRRARAELILFACDAVDAADVEVDVETETETEVTETEEEAETEAETSTSSSRVSARARAVARRVSRVAPEALIERVTGLLREVRKALANDAVADALPKEFEEVLSFLMQSTEEEEEDVEAVVVMEYLRSLPKEELMSLMRRLQAWLTEFRSSREAVHADASSRVRVQGSSSLVIEGEGELEGSVEVEKSAEIQIADGSVLRLRRTRSSSQSRVEAEAEAEGEGDKTSSTSSPSSPPRVRLSGRVELAGNATLELAGAQLDGRLQVGGNASVRVFPDVDCEASGSVCRTQLGRMAPSEATAGAGTGADQLRDARRRDPRRNVTLAFASREARRAELTLVRSLRRQQEREQEQESTASSSSASSAVAVDRARSMLRTVGGLSEADMAQLEARMRSAAESDRARSADALSGAGNPVDLVAPGSTSSSGAESGADTDAAADAAAPDGPDGVVSELDGERVDDDTASDAILRDPEEEAARKQIETDEGTDEAEAEAEASRRAALEAQMAERRLQRAARELEQSRRRCMRWVEADWTQALKKAQAQAQGAEIEAMHVEMQHVMEMTDPEVTLAYVRELLARAGIPLAEEAAPLHVWRMCGDARIAARALRRYMQEQEQEEEASDASTNTNTATAEPIAEPTSAAPSAKPAAEPSAEPQPDTPDVMPSVSPQARPFEGEETGGDAGGDIGEPDSGSFQADTTTRRSLRSSSRQTQEETEAEAEAKEQEQKELPIDELLRQLRELRDAIIQWDGSMTGALTDAEREAMWARSDAEESLLVRARAALQADPDSPALAKLRALLVMRYAHLRRTLEALKRAQQPLSRTPASTTTTTTPALVVSRGARVSLTGFLDGQTAVRVEEGAELHVDHDMHEDEEDEEEPVMEAEQEDSDSRRPRPAVEENAARALRRVFGNDRLAAPIDEAPRRPRPRPLEEEEEKPVEDDDDSNDDDDDLGGAIICVGGRLTGTGMLSVPRVIGQNITVAPGNSPGNLAVAGDLSLGAGSTLEVEVQGYGAGEYDRIAVEGTASVDGATVNVVASDGLGAPPAGTELVFLQASAVAGRMEVTSNDPAVISALRVANADGQTVAPDAGFAEAAAPGAGSNDDTTTTTGGGGGGGDDDSGSFPAGIVAAAVCVVAVGGALAAWMVIQRKKRAKASAAASAGRSGDWGIQNPIRKANAAAPGV